jgi:hypothetical protein
MSIRPHLSAPLRSIIRLSAAVALVLPLAGALTALVTQSAPAAAVTSLSTPQLQAGATPDPTTSRTQLYATVSPPVGASPSAPVPTGSVHLVFTDGVRHFDPGSYALDATGHVAIDDAFSNSSHLYTFTATYSGDGNYASATTSFSVHVLNPSNTSLSLALNPAKAGQSIPLNATVSDGYGTAETPTGTVTFLDGSTVLGTATLTNGVASLLVTLSQGTHDSIIAQYEGDGAHFGSYTEPTTEQVDPADPPVADAGPAVSGRKGTVVTVDGTRSSDPQGEPLTYSWNQIGGLPATIADKSSASTSVTLPNKASKVTLRLTVTNAAGLSSTSDVTITVSPK